MKYQTQLIFHLLRLLQSKRHAPLCQVWLNDLVHITQSNWLFHKSVTYNYNCELKDRLTTMSLFKLIIRFSNKISNDSTLLELELVTYGWRLSNIGIISNVTTQPHAHLNAERKKKQNNLVLHWRNSTNITKA